MDSPGPPLSVNILQRQGGTELGLEALVRARTAHRSIGASSRDLWVQEQEFNTQSDSMRFSTVVTLVSGLASGAV